jgi:hypothetical protein
MPDVDSIIAVQDKRDALFVPGYLLSESGRQRVNFITAQEDTANQSLIKFQQHIAGLKIPIGDARAECLAPVFTVETTNKSPTHFMRLVPYVALVTVGVDVSEFQRRHSVDMVIVPKEEYWCHLR